MSNPVLLLRLEGNFQSWGDRSRFWNRETQVFPTKSAVIGLLFCAMGLSGECKEELAQFADMKMTSYRIGEKNKTPAPILSDFHMVGNGYSESDPWQLECIPKTSEGKKAVNGGARLTRREYLQNYRFAVLLEIPVEWMQRIEEGLKNPVWDIYLGRKNCIPSSNVFDGFYANSDDAEKAIRNKLLEERIEKNSPELALLAMQRDAQLGDESTRILQDIPIAFGPRKQYRVRRVCEISINQ